MGRFFPKALQEGMPISTRGLAKGLQGIAYAFEYMEIDGGYITWSGSNVPTLHIDLSASAAGPDGFFGGLTSMSSPTHVLGRKPVDANDLTKGYVYGWVETVTHASQHPEAE
jgi:hypothetical protein